MADEKTFTKAELDAAIEAAVGKVQESIDKLEAKNEELVGDLRKSRAEARKAKDIDPADLERLESERDELKGKLTAAEKLAKDATTAREKAEKALDTESAFTRKLVVENGLREQLTAAGVTNPAHQKGAIAILAGQVELAADGDNRIAKVGDKALADFIKEWASTDEGKAFVLAPVNSGGNAPGNARAKADAKTITRDAYNALDQQAQGEAGLQMAKGELKIVDIAA